MTLCESFVNIMDQNVSILTTVLVNTMAGRDLIAIKRVASIAATLKCLPPT